MKLSPDLERKVLELAGETQSAAAKPEAVSLVDAQFVAPNVWTLPVVTAAEVNNRDWRARSARTQAARKAMSRAFGPTLAHVARFADHYHAGGELRIQFVRLGGRRMDRSNLPTALKAVEDALACILGADDGDPRWLATWEQTPGGALGVRITIAIGARL